MYISYLRVSTKEQGDSRLGLEAQRAAIERFAGSSVVEEYVEVASGGNMDRPILKEALAACHKHNATLVVAKQCRLARRALHVCQLLEDGVPFVVADSPSATREWLQMRAVWDEFERRVIGERTRAALAAKKARGETWGPPREVRLAALRAGTATNKQRAREARDRVYARCRSLRDAGRSLQEIASILNGSGERTRRGGLYGPVQVYRVLGGQTGGHAGRF